MEIMLIFNSISAATSPAFVSLILAYTLLLALLSIPQSTFGTIRLLFAFLEG